MTTLEPFNNGTAGSTSTCPRGMRPILFERMNIFSAPLLQNNPTGSTTAQHTTSKHRKPATSDDSTVDNMGGFAPEAEPGNGKAQTVLEIGPERSDENMPDAGEQNKSADDNLSVDEEAN